MRFSILIPGLFLMAASVGAHADMGAPPSGGSAAPALTTAQAAAKAANAKAATVNGLIDQAQKAQDAKDWAGAEKLLLQLSAMEPGRWDIAQHLGDAEYNENKFAAAVQTYEGALKAAEQDTTDPAGAKQAMGAMYLNEGNAYLKLKKNKDAIAAYDKAAPLSDQPGLVYYNVCVILFNAKEDDGAVAACDKAIAADPTKAEAYYIKGTVLVGEGETNDKGDFVVPKGTVESLKTYLKLAPHGPHAGDVQQMLDLIGKP